MGRSAEVVTGLFRVVLLLLDVDNEFAPSSTFPNAPSRFIGHAVLLCFIPRVLYRSREDGISCTCKANVWTMGYYLYATYLLEEIGSIYIHF